MCNFKGTLFKFVMINNCYRPLKLIENKNTKVIQLKRRNVAYFFSSLCYKWLYLPWSRWSVLDDFSHQLPN